MGIFTEELKSNRAVIRFDIVGGPERETIAEDMSFLNYRLGSVDTSREVTKDKADIVWNVEKEPKAIRYEGGQLILDGKWEEGELNKIMVSMLANEMDKVGLHPFHSSSVIYKGKGILLIGGENNHGKSMTQLEGCVRGASIFSTETTVMDDATGIALYGSKNIYVRKRAKGTERSDLADQDQGVTMFFGNEPNMDMCYDPSTMDLAVLPCIDGHFQTQVSPMGQFEKCYQCFHSMMNFFGMNQLLCGESGCVMPIVDTDERRQARGKWLSKWVRDIPCYMIRAKSPQLLFDEIDKIMKELYGL